MSALLTTSPGNVAWTLGLVGGGACVLLFAALAPLARLIDRRSLIGVGLAMLVLVPLGAGRWLVARHAAGMALDSGLLRAVAAAREVPGLPVAGAEGARRGSPAEGIEGELGDVFVLQRHEPPLRLTAGEEIGPVVAERAAYSWPVALIPGAIWTVGDLVELCGWIDRDGPAGNWMDGPRHGEVTLYPELHVPPLELAHLLGLTDPDDPTVRSGSRDDDRSERVRAQVAGTAEITFGAPDDEGAVTRYLSRVRGQIKACYEEELWENPELAGSVEVVWTVEPDGHVSDVSVYANSTGNMHLADCLVRRIRRWTFPAGGDEFEISYPFRFSSS